MEWRGGGGEVEWRGREERWSGEVEKRGGVER